MSEASSAPANSPSGASAVEAAAIVHFAAVQADAEFVEAPQSDWAFAGQHGAGDGEALDTIGAEEPTLPPLMALATFAVAEAEFFVAENPLVAFDPAGESEDTGSIMWSGEALAEAEAPVPIEGSYATVIVLHDVVTYGISLDWTDSLYS